MRYTEVRMAKIGHQLLEDIDKETVDFGPNYDGSEREPLILPAKIPNLLINGSSGIAVGMATSIPPHNAAELIDACLMLLKRPEATTADLMEHVRGPDFPTGGVIVEPRESILESYRSGRGAFRLRARWEIEQLPRGLWQIIVTEIPYQVAKSKLIEKLAEVIQLKKVPLLADVRDESADDVRIVLEPRAKTVDPDQLMGMLMRVTDLEIRFSLNMNVLIDGRTPRVCSLREVLRAFLDHRRAVLKRRSQHRLDKIDHRLEVLEGFIIAYLNLDRVIDIIRYDDSPRDALMREEWGRKFKRATSEADYRSPPPGDGELTEVQAEAILNMRLRSLRRLEEMELRRERDELLRERADLDDLLQSDARQWARIGTDLEALRATFGAGTALGRRRSTFAEAAEGEILAPEAMIEREPITLVLSKMGWIRAMKGHLPPETDFKFKDGDEGALTLHAETTDKIILFGSNGRFFTLLGANLPGGRGMGEPVRLMVDLPNEAQIVNLFLHRPGGRMVVASSDGDGFLVPTDELLAQTRAGKQVLNLRDGAKALICKPASGDHVAVVGENRKLLVFPLAELPEMGRGKGVRLQAYKDGGLSDLTTITLTQGLSWKDPAGRTRLEADLAEWLGKRASAGRMAPRGFPRDNHFA